MIRYLEKCYGRLALERNRGRSGAEDSKPNKKFNMHL